MIGLIKPGAYPASQHKVFFGPNEILLPIYSTISKAVASQPQASVFINYASYRYVFEPTKSWTNKFQKPFLLPFVAFLPTRELVASLCSVANVIVNIL